VSFLAFGLTLATVSLSTLPHSASSPEFFLTQIVCRDDGNRFCNPNLDLYAEKLTDLPNCIGPDFSEHPCLKTDRLVPIVANQQQLKADFPNRTSSIINAKLLTNDLKRSMTNISFVSGLFTSLLVALTFLTIRKSSYGGPYLFTILVSTAFTENFVVRASIAPIGVSTTSMLSALVLTYAIMNNSSTKYQTYLMYLLLFVQLVLVSLFRQDQAMILMATVFLITVVDVLRYIITGGSKQPISGYFQKRTFLVGLVGCTIGACLVSPFVASSDKSVISKVRDSVDYVVPKYIAAPSMGTRLSTELGSSSFQNTLVEFLKSPIYYSINVGRFLLDLVHSSGYQQSQWIPFLVGIFVFLVVFFLIVFLKTDFKRWPFLTMGPVILVVMLVTLKGVLDAGTRSNLRYVFALFQFLLFLVFKSGLDANPRKFVQRIDCWIYGILLLQAFIITIYLSKSSGMDFGYVYIGSVGLSLLASALLLLSGKLLTSLARWSID
jgi:hypothetical protein